MDTVRSSGVSLHITSLPGKYGIGTLGKEAFAFVDLLREGGQKYWHFLPINPVSPKFIYSSYSSVSTFAGNPLFINIEIIDQEDWMKDDILSGLPLNDLNSKIDYDEIISFKMPYLRKAFENFLKYAGEDAKNYFNYFCQDQKYWLDDYVLFASLSVHFDNFNWFNWDSDIVMRKPKSLKKWREKLHSEIEFQKFLQFIFLKQWFALKKYANNKGIKLIGEIPLYVNFDSSDTWCHPEIFQLERKNLVLKCVSGVPPDLLSKTGEKWGTPLYKWFNGKKLNENTLKWWINRIRHATNFVDVIKLNHFRGYESYWSIPFNEKFAENGKWEKGPGIHFFNRLNEEIPNLSFIAEDWRYSSTQADKIRDDLKIPGIKVLQYAFDFNKKNSLLPYNFVNANFVVFTSMQFDYTINAWFLGTEMDDEKRNYVMEYIGADKWDEFHWHFIVLALGSIAQLTIFPIQDILGLRDESSIEILTKKKDNWNWKLIPGELSPDVFVKLKKKCDIFGRI